MHISAAVTTCPREVDYLPQTLESLRAAGFEYPLVIRDGRPTLGPKATFKRALWSLRGAEWMLIFQDDIMVARGLRSWLEQQHASRWWEEHTPAVLSLYCSAPQDSHDDGWRRLNLEPQTWDAAPWMRSLGACALLLHESIATGFLAHDPQQGRADRIGGALGQFCYEKNVPFYVHSPSLVQHIGDVSVRNGVQITAERRAARFCDDVRSLGLPVVVAASVASARDRREPSIPCR